MINFVFAFLLIFLTSCTHGFLREKIAPSQLHKNLIIEIALSSGDIYKGLLIDSKSDSLSLARYTIEWHGNTYKPIIQDTIYVNVKEVKQIFIVSAVPQSRNFRQLFAGLLLASSLLIIILSGALGGIP